MIKVIGVRFKKAGKIYYFDPAGLDIEKGNFVVVETARGIEFGECVIGLKEINENLFDLESLRITILGLEFHIVSSTFNLDVYSLYLNSKLHSILFPA